MTPIYEKENVKIFVDEDPQDPRTEWDNLGTMVCFHNKYNLGDKDHGYKQSDYKGWNALEYQLRIEHNPCVVLPIFMYDHSGITISTTPFSCPWDSGQIGFIYCSEALALKKEADYTKMAEYLHQEVEDYNKYLTGECYGYVCEAKPQYSVERGHCIMKNGDILFRLRDASAEHDALVVDALNAYDPSDLDSCWGFYEYTPEELADMVLNETFNMKKGEIK